MYSWIPCIERALVLKSMTGYMMGLNPIESSLLLMAWKKRKEEDKTGLGIHMHQKERLFFVLDIPHLLKLPETI